MKVTEVTVTIHEKKNHPHEYGHYDASVTLTARPEQDEHCDNVIESLQREARRRVIEEIDSWIAFINYEKRQQELRDAAEDHIERASWTQGSIEEYQNAYRFKQARLALRAIHGLEESLEREDMKNRLRKALRESKKYMEDGGDQIPF